MRFSAFLLVLLLLSLPRNAFAGELTYEAPGGCPSREDVAGRVAARAPDRRDANFAITKKGAGYAAHLTIGEGEDALARDVEGRTCDAVVDAAVLVLALDHVVLAPPPPPVAAAPSIPVSDTPTAARVDSNEPPRKPLAIAVGADAEMRSFVGGTIGGGTLFGELSAPALFGWSRFRPSARLGGTYQASPSEGTRFLGITAEVCPLGLDAVQARSVDLTLSACGVLHGGSIHNVTSGSWFDAGGLARAKVTVGARGHTRAFFELSAAGGHGLGEPRRWRAPAGTSASGRERERAPADAERARSS